MQQQNATNQAKIRGLYLTPEIPEAFASQIQAKQLELQELTQQMNDKTGNNVMDRVEEPLQVSVANKKLVEEIRAGALKEWHTLRKTPEMSHPEVRRALMFIQKRETQHPNVCKIMEISLVIQTSNAQAEPVFTDIFAVETRFKK